jgi:hypothetical protein
VVLQPFACFQNDEIVEFFFVSLDTFSKATIIFQRSISNAKPVILMGQNETRILFFDETNFKLECFT